MRKVIGVICVLLGFVVTPAAVPQGGVEYAAIPVWTMEVLDVKPGMFGAALGQLDDTWMRIRAEAKRQGAVLNYNRIAEHGGEEARRSIVLLTEFKDEATRKNSEKLFAAIAARLPNNTSAVIRPRPQAELYESKSVRVFQDYSDRDDARLRLLSKN
jgi:hypothetical protein